MEMKFTKKDGLGEATFIAPSSVERTSPKKYYDKVIDATQTKMGLPIDFCLDFDALKSDSILNFIDDEDFVAAACELVWEMRKFYYKYKNQTTKFDDVRQEFICSSPSQFGYRDFLVDILNHSVMSEKLKTKLFSFFDIKREMINHYVMDNVLGYNEINFYNLAEKNEFLSEFHELLFESRKCLKETFDLKL